MFKLKLTWPTPKGEDIRKLVLRTDSYVTGHVK